MSESPILASDYFELDRDLTQKRRWWLDTPKSAGKSGSFTVEPNPGELGRKAILASRTEWTEWTDQVAARMRARWWFGCARGWVFLSGEARLCRRPPAPMPPKAASR